MTKTTYTKRQKATAVLAAEMTNPKAASEATGIPRTTLLQWLDRPEYVILRHNAREAIAEEAIVVARLAWHALGDAIRAGKVEARELISAAGMATEKALLASGEATARTERVDLTIDEDTIDRIEAALKRGDSSIRSGLPAGLELPHNGTGGNGLH